MPRIAHLAIPLLLLTACAPTGCAPLNAALSPHSITAGKTVDEKALGVLYSTAALANISIARAAPFMTLEQAVEAKRLKGIYTAAITDAERMKTKLDADGYGAKIEAARTAIDAVTRLLASIKGA